MYLWLPARLLLSPDAVLVVVVGLCGHEEDLVNEGTVVGFSDEPDPISLLSPAS